jgi:hypothetical protein
MPILVGILWHPLASLNAGGVIFRGKMGWGARMPSKNPGTLDWNGFGFFHGIVLRIEQWLFQVAQSI